MQDPRTAIVRAGYDAMAERYLAWGPTIGDPRERMLDELTARLLAGSRVLELGCGAGVPSTRRLAERHVVTGVDVSAGGSWAGPRAPSASHNLHAVRPAVQPADCAPTHVGSRAG